MERQSTFKKQEEKNQLEKNSENKIVKTGELELHLGRIKQRAPRTWLELVPKWRCCPEQEAPQERKTRGGLETQETGRVRTRTK